MTHRRYLSSLILTTMALATILYSSSGCVSSHHRQPPDRQTVTLSARQQLYADLNAIFDNPKYSNAFWGVRIEKASGEVLYDRLGHKSFTPASNMKVFTTAAALDILGPDYTYKTKLDAIGKITEDGTLIGDLVIVGSGDPSLGAWHPDKDKNSKQLLEDWATKIRQAGIKRIQGNIIGDGRYFTRDYYSPWWDYFDLPYWYATGSSGLAMEENAYRVTIVPGPTVGSPAVITMTPATSYVTLINETETVEAGGKSNADGAWQMTEGNIKRFNKTIAIDKKVINERGSVWDGAKYAAHLLMEELQREGIEVTGSPFNIRELKNTDHIDGAGPSELTNITVTISPPMSEIIKVINKPSHNFFADQVLRTLGMVVKNEGSFDAGTAVVREWLEKIKAPQLKAYQMFDGSGLAADNFIQPQQMCHVLRYMRNSPKLGKIFFESLPVGGKESGLRKRLQWECTKGNVHAKTGYISNVRSLSGYVTDADGEELVFSMICNKYVVPTKEVNESQDLACKVMALFSDK